MDTKQYCLIVIEALNEIIQDVDWFDDESKIQFIYDRADGLRTAMYLRRASDSLQCKGCENERY